MALFLWNTRQKVRILVLAHYSHEHHYTSGSPAFSLCASANPLLPPLNQSFCQGNWHQILSHFHPLLSFPSLPFGRCFYAKRWKKALGFKAQRVITWVSGPWRQIKPNLNCVASIKIPNSYSQMKFPLFWLPNRKPW